MIASWLSSDQFTTCGKLPKRVIDVGTGSQERLYLSIDHNSSNEDDKRYICLSHCWGHGKPLETTTSSLPDRIKAIVFADLSETFKDCIRLTRFLGIKYLWIDSLCIVQDSKLDWEEESSKMGDYYSSSWLTILAGASTPKQGALFTYRVPEESLQLQLKWRGNVSSISMKIEADQAQTCTVDLGASALDSRGWTLQEQILPARFLEFGPTQVSYRNKEYIRYECGRVLDIQHTQIPRRDIFLKPGSWFRLVECYTKRSLTVSEDKLPALSGLAHEYQRTSGDRYLAGIWSRELWKGLFWRRDVDCLRSSGPEIYRAPSWSWAAVNGSIIYLDKEIGGKEDLDRKQMIEIIESWVQPAGSDKMGRVKYGSLLLRGQLTVAVVEPPDDQQRCFICSEKSDTTPRKWTFFPDEDFKQLPQMFYILHLANGKGLALMKNARTGVQQHSRGYRGTLEVLRRIGFVEAEQSTVKTASTKLIWPFKKKRKNRFLLI